jgi:hypothetical protein
MSLRPSLIVAVQMARHRQTLSDQLVLGLVTGGLLGPGLVIEGRESDCIRFRKQGGALRPGPDRGEILLTQDTAGGTQVECRIWCGGLALRRALEGILLGVGIAGLLLAGLWLLGVTAPLRAQSAGAGGLLCALASYVLGRRSDSAHLRRQVLAFLHNTTYLKAI